MASKIQLAGARIALFLIASLFFGNQSYACSLVDTPFETYFDRADHVFVGHLNDGQAGAEPNASVNTLTVTKRFKGAEFDQIIIQIVEFPTSCDIQLYAGQDYLFFENGDPPFQPTMGTGTRGLNFLPEDWATALEQLESQ